MLIDGEDAYIRKNWRTIKEIVEITPWRLNHWHEQIVSRSEEWWDSIKPMIDLFWEDVEKARCGEFVVPESTRQAKKQKVDQFFEHLKNQTPFAF